MSLIAASKMRVYRLTRNDSRVTSIIWWGCSLSTNRHLWFRLSHSRQHQTQTMCLFQLSNSCPSIMAKIRHQQLSRSSSKSMPSTTALAKPSCSRWAMGAIRTSSLIAAKVSNPCRPKLCQTSCQLATQCKSTNKVAKPQQETHDAPSTRPNKWASMFSIGLVIATSFSSTKQIATFLTLIIMEAVKNHTCSAQRPRKSNW